MPTEITLRPITRDMYHAFFMQYENDPDLYLDKSDFRLISTDAQRKHYRIDRDAWTP